MSVSHKKNARNHLVFITYQLRQITGNQLGVAFWETHHKMRLEGQQKWLLVVKAEETRWQFYHALMLMVHSMHHPKFSTNVVS